MNKPYITRCGANYAGLIDLSPALSAKPQTSRGVPPAVSTRAAAALHSRDNLLRPKTGKDSVS